MAGNKQYYFVSKMKLEEKEREKRNLEVMKANEVFYRKHIVGKKDNDNQFNDTIKMADDKVNQENKTTKNKKIKELRSFLGYRNRTDFCIAHNYQLFKLNACIDKLNDDKKEINEKNIASYMKEMDNRLNKTKQFATNFIADKEIQKEQEEIKISKLARNKIIQDAVKKNETKTIEKQQEEINKLQDRLDKLEVKVDKLQQQLTDICQKLCNIFLLYGKNKK